MLTGNPKRETTNARARRDARGGVGPGYTSSPDQTTCPFHRWIGLNKRGTETDYSEQWPNTREAATRQPCTAGLCKAKLHTMRDNELGDSKSCRGAMLNFKHPGQSTCLAQDATARLTREVDSGPTQTERGALAQSHSPFLVHRVSTHGWTFVLLFQLRKARYVTPPAVATPTVSISHHPELQH